MSSGWQNDGILMTNCLHAIAYGLYEEKRVNPQQVSICMTLLFVLLLPLKHHLAPLQRVAATAADIAKGELHSRAEVTGSGDIKLLEGSMDQMVVSLRELVSEIGRVAHLIKDASGSVDDIAQCTYGDVVT
jgi:methyl-accepting chemotaxis protein